jgi:hypothetical protein
MQTIGNVLTAGAQKSYTLKIYDEFEENNRIFSNSQALQNKKGTIKNAGVLLCSSLKKLLSAAKNLNFTLVIRLDLISFLQTAGLAAIFMNTNSQFRATRRGIKYSLHP